MEAETRRGKRSIVIFSSQESVRQIKYVSMINYCGTRRINKRYPNSANRRVPQKIPVRLFNNGSGDSPGKE